MVPFGTNVLSEIKICSVELRARRKKKTINKIQHRQTSMCPAVDGGIICIYK